jgi:hypothetical protein
MSRSYCKCPMHGRQPHGANCFCGRRMEYIELEHNEGFMPTYPTPNPPQYQQQQYQQPQQYHVPQHYPQYAPQYGGQGYMGYGQPTMVVDQYGQHRMAVPVQRVTVVHPMYSSYL